MATAANTGIGQIEAVDMEDGARIVANTNSHLSVSMTATRRQVVLDRGEAFFEAELAPGHAGF